MMQADTTTEMRALLLAGDQLMAESKAHWAQIERALEGVADVKAVLGDALRALESAPQASVCK